MSRKLIGALTSKSYSFKGRHWEIEGIESIDVLEGLCSNIRIDVRGATIMRILPRLREDINEEWIGNRIRFFYDGLRKKRISRPMIYVRGDYYIGLGWYNAMKNVVYKVEKVTSKIEYFLGRALEGEVHLQIKELSTCVGYDKREGGWNIRKTYLGSSKMVNLSKYKTLVLIGTNLRREAPLIEAKMRQTLLKIRGLVLGLWDESSNISRSVGMGVDTRRMTKFVEGRDKKCRWVCRSSNPLLLVTEEGKREWLECCLNLRKYLGDYGGWGIIYKEGGLVMKRELGVVERRFMNKEKIVYIIQQDEMEVAGEQYKVYQGTVGDRMITFCNKILPGTNFLEKEGLYMNMEGKLQYTNLLFEPPGLSRLDWKILRVKSHVLNIKDWGYMALTTLRSRLYEVCPGLKNINYYNKLILFEFYPNWIEHYNGRYGWNEWIKSYYYSGTTARLSEVLAINSRLDTKVSNFY
jgi:NADH dehydrogenase/NADH:ubiquinone oxidoreductase subunit G